jgi:hypothetical protein
MWNPLALLETVGSAHNDGLMLTLALAGIWLAANRMRWLVALLLLWAATLVKWVPVVLALSVGTTWLSALNGWRVRVVRVVIALSAVAALTLLLYWPWLDAHDPRAFLAGATPAGDRYVNALVDLPTPWLAAHWIDPHGLDLGGAETRIRVWTEIAVRVLFCGYLVFELAYLWRSAGDLRAAIDTSTRILLVALLLVFTQVLAWYFIWPLTLGIILGRRSASGTLAVVYSVVYLPIFYATHENVLSTTTAVPFLLAYALVPPLVVRQWSQTARSRQTVLAGAGWTSIAPSTGSEGGAP